VSWLTDIRRFRRSVLGLNRRNQDYVFRYNAREAFLVIDNKIATKVALSTHGIPVPRSFAVFQVPWDLRRLGWAVRRLEDFVMKPARGSGGGGILVITGRENGHFRKSSGARLTTRDLEDHASDILAGAYSRNQRQDEAMLEYRVRPDPVIGGMSFGGVGDVRVLVLLGVPILAMLRLPTRRSDGRANLHVGGIGVGVDLSTGRTMRAWSRDGALERHPDLGVPLGGVTLPCFSQILEIAASCHDAAGLGYFGADVVVDEEHGPMVLELNARPGLGIQLANGRGLRPLAEEIERRKLDGLTARERTLLGREVFAQTHEDGEVVLRDRP
jgi:alpha-L-glutamate ligase-like protein